MSSRHAPARRAALPDQACGAVAEWSESKTAPQVPTRTLYRAPCFRNERPLDAPLCQIRHAERWPSGRRRTPGKCVYGNPVSRVRIPPAPPINKSSIRNEKKREGTAQFCGVPATNPDCAETANGEHSLVSRRFLSRRFSWSGIALDARSSIARRNRRVRAALSSKQGSHPP